MNVLKMIGLIVYGLSFVAALGGFYDGWKGLSEMTPVEAYVDKGVFSFKPVKIYPHQVKNHDPSSRSRRMHPNKVEYVVLYNCVREKTYYQYKLNTKSASKTEAENILNAGEIIKRRVLAIPSEHSYVTVEAHQTAESYTDGLTTKYLYLARICLGLIVAWIISFVFLLRYIKRRTQQRQTP